MDSLQRWFDGADVVALFVAVLGTCLSLWSIRRQSRIDAANDRIQAQARALLSEQLSLQQRMTDLEEDRRADETVRSGSADVRAAIWFSLVGQRGNQIYETTVEIKNVGMAPATDVVVDKFRSVKTNKDIDFLELPKAIPEIPSEDRVTYPGFVSMDEGHEFAVVLRWQDKRGPQDRNLFITRSRRS
jgi:hypothetical protein